MEERFKKLILLHSNDMHGDFMTEQKDDKLIGGISLLSGYIGTVRTQEPNTIYCIAGDMFQGSVIDTEYHGLSTIELMNMLSPDVVTLGNHEVDYGLSHLLFIEKCASFPIINANLHIKTNGARLFSPCKIIEIDGMKILFIGILTEQVLAQTKTEQFIGALVDIEDAAREVGKICNAYNATDIDFTVLLTHIGFEEDKALAGILDPSWGVDVIIGGHSHTFLTEPAVVNGIQIVQAGTGTDQIGRFDIIVDTETNSIYSSSWQAVPIDAEHCVRDNDLEKLLDVFKVETDRKYNRVITRLNMRLTAPGRFRETELGDLFSDILAESLGIEIMLLASGNIRAKTLGPIVTYEELVRAFPYDDPVYCLTLKGSVIKEMFRFMLRDDVWEGKHVEFFQFSDRLKVTYSVPGHEFLEFTMDGDPVADEVSYTIGIQKWHYQNFKMCFGIELETIEKIGKVRILATSCQEVMEEYMSSHQHLGHPVDGRLTVIMEESNG